MAKEFNRKPLADNIKEINLHDSDPNQIGVKLKGANLIKETGASPTGGKPDTPPTSAKYKTLGMEHTPDTDYTHNTDKKSDTDATQDTSLKDHTDTKHHAYNNAYADHADNTSDTSLPVVKANTNNGLIKTRPAKKTPSKIERFKKTISFQQKYIDFIEYYKHDLRISDSNEFLERIIDFYAEKKKLPFDLK
jgi:hypothetical protein